MKTFYVYELWDPIKKEPFYVGKGKHRSGYSPRYEDHLKRALEIKNSRDRNYHKLNRIRKIVRSGFQPEIKIIIETENETEALEKEIKLIKFYGRRDKKTGILTNMTDGGDGISGRVCTEEDRKKRSLRFRGSRNPMYGIHRIGKDNPFYGKTHNKKTRDKLSKTHKGKIISIETRKKMADALKGQKTRNNRKIIKNERNLYV